VSGFPAGWLALREPYDRAAADPGLAEALAAWAGSRRPLHVVDLGAGTGANLRRLAPALGPGQRWTLVEIDPALSEAGRRTLPPFARYRRLDLARDLELLADDPADLLTVSALIDLVSADWLRRLADLRRRLGCALLVALTYDGRIAWNPADPLDEVARALVNRHQRTDKGFGPALGPEAAPTLAAMLAGEGAPPRLATSDWRLGPGDRAIQQALLDGYASAAASLDPTRAADLEGWRHRRTGVLAAGASRLAVGHLDLLFLPAP
jgi:SAM-dependent methyltransferase